MAIRKHDRFFGPVLVFLSLFHVGAVAVRADTADEIGDAFEDVMRRATAPDSPFMRRPVFAKAHGCLKAKFTPDAKIPKKYRLGAFSKPWLPAWIRFANDGGYGPDTRKSARGMAVKLIGVNDEPKLLEGEEDAVTQDFIAQNHPIFFVDNAEVFLAFTQAALSLDPLLKPAYDKVHPETEAIFAEMDKNLLADPLDGTYWTPTPYRLGPDMAMKYMFKPCREVPDPPTKAMVGKDFLRNNLREHMKEKNRACMEMWVQLRTDPDAMPLDEATKKWSEEKSKFRKYGTLDIPTHQDIDDKQRELICENLSFTGWHATADFEPLGSINAVRRKIYKRMAEVRRRYNPHLNKELLKEPTALTLE